jgi:hypothetical protein
MFKAAPKEAPPPAPKPVARPAARPAPRRKKRSYLPIVLIAGGVVLALAVILFLALRN